MVFFRFLKINNMVYKLWLWYNYVKNLISWKIQFRKIRFDGNYFMVVKRLFLGNIVVRQKEKWG